MSSLPPAQSASFNTANVRIPTRHEVRAVVTQNQEERMAAIGRGENIHQFALDQNDKVLAYSRLLEQVHGPDAAVAFLNMVAEETRAVTAHTEAKTRETEARTREMQAKTREIEAKTQRLLSQQQAAQNDGAEAVGKAIGAIILVLFFFWILSTIGSR